MGNFTGKTWTPKRIEWLKSLWVEGKTAAQIAAIIGNGISRNSVIGAARRAGCDARKSPIIRLSAEQKANREAAPSRPAQRLAPSNLTACIGGSPTRANLKAQVVYAQRRFEQPVSAPAVKTAPPLQREPKAEKPTVPWDGKKVRFHDLRAGQCKWIDGPTVPWHADEAMACTAPTMTERPYCSHHCEKAAGKPAQNPDAVAA